jgi:hypothetical protein
MGFEHAAYLVSGQGLDQIVDRPKLHCLGVAAHVKATRYHQNRQTAVNLCCAL